MSSTTPVRAPRPSADLARSWLLVNAAAPATFDAAVDSSADRIILDIEDAVDPSRKSAAREDVARWLEDGHRAWVRVNDATSAFWADDLTRLRECAGLEGIVLAKTEDADQVAESNRLLGGDVPIIPLLESAVGIELATNIAAAPGVARLAFGSGDYRRDTGASADDLAMAYPRSRIVVSSRVAGLPGPIDGPTLSTNLGALRAGAAHAVSLGLTGKLCLAPEHASALNETMSPTTSDIEWATTFLADFQARSGVVRDGSDLPRLGRARTIRALATAYGLG